MAGILWSHPPSRRRRGGGPRRVLGVSLALSLVSGGLLQAAPSEPSWTRNGSKTAASMGLALASGDVNGDGYDDLVVALPFWTESTPSSPNLGRIHVYHGGPAGLGPVPDWWYEGTRPGESLGYSVASGDVNGDGYDDLILGNINDAWSAPVFIHHGSVDGLSSTPDRTISSSDDSEYFGHSVATGDVNGDGYDDLLVGAPRFSGGEIEEGRVYLFLGSAEGLSGISVWSFESDSAGAELGTGLAAAGDVNDDGYDDVLVGAPDLDVDGTLLGGVFLFYGSSEGPAAAPDWRVTGEQEGEGLGRSVAFTGDTDGDGFPEIAVGAPDFDSPERWAGRVLVYRGSATGPSEEADWSAVGAFEGATSGFSVAGAGDVDGDGFDELVVGAPAYGAVPPATGSAAVYAGGPGGLSSEPYWTMDSALGDSSFGRALTSAGDVDGDGRAELAVGAPDWTEVYVSQGAAFLYDLSAWPAGMHLRGDKGSALWIRKDAGDDLQLSWSGSCLGTDDDFAVYEGDIGGFLGHEPVLCSTGHETSVVITPRGGSTYYLVVPRNYQREGSYGLDGDGAERLPAFEPCAAQLVGACD